MSDDPDLELARLLERWSEKHNRRYVCIYEQADGTTARLYPLDVDPDVVMRTVLSWGSPPNVEIIHNDGSGKRTVRMVTKTGNEH